MVDEITISLTEDEAKAVACVLGTSYSDEFENIPAELYHSLANAGYKGWSGGWSVEQRRVGDMPKKLPCT